MQIDRVLYPIESLGPGKRLVIWTVGCSKHCIRCANSELWCPDEARDISVNDLFAMIQTAVDGRLVDGITITGGDPMEQLDDLLQLLEKLQAISSDILVYTGYTLEELTAILSKKQKCKLHQYMAALVEGRYVDELNDGKIPLRGSTNQRLLIKDHFLEKYQQYLKSGRSIQNIYTSHGVISVGIHNRE